MYTALFPTIVARCEMFDVAQTMIPFAKFAELRKSHNEQWSLDLSLLFKRAPSAFSIEKDVSLSKVTYLPTQTVLLFVCLVQVAGASKKKKREGGWR